MGCGASKTNAIAPESATIETRPKPEPPQTTTDKVQVASPSEPVTAENNAPPSPTPSERSTSSRISVRSKQSSTRPGSGRGKSSMRKRLEKMRQDGIEMKDSSEGDSGKSKRGPSAISADSGYTADSEIGPFEDDPPSADREEEEPAANSQEEAAEECPSPPDLTVQGVAIRSRKSHSATRRHQGSLPPLTPISLKAAVKSSSTPVLATDPPNAQEEPLTPGFGRSVSFADKVEVISPQMIERPASRGGLAFDLQFTPDTGNVKRTPSRVQQLDRARKCKSADVLRRELEERMQAAEDRKKVCAGVWLNTYVIYDYLQWYILYIE